MSTDRPPDSVRQEYAPTAPTAPTANTYADANVLPEALEFPTKALPSSCWQFVEEAEKAIGCPADLLGLPLLATLSAGIGNSRVVEIKRSWREGATLFLATVADPGKKKTPAAKHATAPIWERQTELKRSYAEKVEEYESEMREHEKDKRESRKNNEADPSPPEEPTMGRTVTEDTTVEALASILEDNPRGVAVVKDELAGWVRSMDQYKSGKGADRQAWLSLWSNSPIAVDRKGRKEPLIVPRPWVSITGSIQPGVLNELADGREDGLLDRFLFAYPAPTRSRLTRAEISASAENRFKKLYNGLAQLKMGEDKTGEPCPRAVPMSPEAWELFAEIASGLDEETQEPGFSSRLSGVWSKLEAYLARIALILALCRYVNGRGPEQVEAEDVVRASSLIEYFKAHAKRVLTDVYGENGQDRLAESLGKLLRDNGGQWEGSATELWDELKRRKCEVLPRRAEELSKMVLALGSRSATLKAERGWRGDSRVLRIRLVNAVGAVGAVGGEDDA
jgi:hypothetical protein